MSVRKLEGWLVAGLALVFWTSPAMAQSAIDDDFAFASALVQMGFPDYAERLADELQRLNPAEKDRALMIRAESAAARGKFDEAQKIFDSMPKDSPKAQAAMLSLANSLYRMGQPERATDIYKNFFAQYGGQAPKDTDLRKVYMDAGYRYAQMLMNGGDFSGALKAFESVLACKPEESIERPLKTETAQLLVKAARREKNPANRKVLLDRAREICRELQWRTMDLWFGHSIPIMAETYMLEDKRKEAQKVLDQNMDILKQLDGMLAEEGIEPSRSPMAGARFIYGQLFESEGRALAGSDGKKAVELLRTALQHYVNVFAKYGDNPWAIEADSKADELISLLKSMGVNVTIDLGPYRKTAMEARMRTADALYAQRQWEDAAKAYRAVIGTLPPGVESGPAFHNLILCHANLKDDLGVDIVADHIIERHVKDPSAGLALIAAGRTYFENKQEDRCLALYQKFIQYFPKHEKAPQVLYVLASIARQAKKTDLQVKYRNQLIKDFPNDQYSLKAVQALGWQTYAAQDYPAAEGYFRKFIEQTPPSHARAGAQFSLADCLVRQSKYEQAVAEYRKLNEWLAPTEGNPYATTTEELAKVAEMRDQSRFMVGFSLSKIMEPKDAIPALRAKAIEELQKFVADNPTSKTSPKAMNLIGAIYLELGRNADASKVFADLQARYPASEEGKNALYSLVKAALDVNKEDIARKALDDMLANAKDPQGQERYSVEQYALVGQRFLASKMYEEAKRAFARVIELDSPNRAVMENSLYGYGVSQYETGNYTNAITQIQDLLHRWPKTALFCDANLTLARAYRASGNLAKAGDALTAMFSMAKDPLTESIANMEVAQVQEEQAKKAVNDPAKQLDFRRQALASYDRVLMRDMAVNVALKPLHEKALLESIRLFEEIGNYQEAMSLCDVFLEKFSDSAKNAEIRQRKSALRLKAPLVVPAPVPGGGSK